MGTSIKTKTNIKKGVVAACGISGVAAWVFVSWILGVIILGVGVYYAVGLFKYMAGNGQRF